MIVKYQLENHSFLYLELSDSMPDAETKVITWKMALTQTFLQTFITSFKMTLNTFYKIRAISSNPKKKILRYIASEILQNGNMLDIKLNNYFYNYVLVIIVSLTLNSNTLRQKTHKHISTIKLDNKTSEPIQFPKIFTHLTLLTLSYN